MRIGMSTEGLRIAGKGYEVRWQLRRMLAEWGDDAHAAFGEALDARVERWTKKPTMTIPAGGRVISFPRSS